MTVVIANEDVCASAIGYDFVIVFDNVIIIF